MADELFEGLDPDILKFLDSDLLRRGSIDDFLTLRVGEDIIRDYPPSASTPFSPNWLWYSFRGKYELSFIHDFIENSSLLSRFEGNPKLVGAWQLLDNAGVNDALRP